MNQFSRSEMLWGEEGTQRLARSRVAVFGIGGVGGSLAEALARAGVGALDIVDDDKVQLTNLNRQVIALHSALGRDKVDVMRERLLDINPGLRVTAHRLFYLPQTADALDLSVYDYIADAVDTLAAKIELACRAQSLGVPIISAMGAGNKTDPTRFEVADIYGTSVCPLSRVMRQELRKRGVRSLKVVYSREEPVRPRADVTLREENRSVEIPGQAPACAVRRGVPGSLPFMPPVMGLIMAGEIVRAIALDGGGFPGRRGRNGE
ncbi:MAG TPA: tRNA threonylcarbamoyladenosine dehydratase [Candidatus Limnocylindria bacterium]|nr:tRNA threonylcarbamoyladenosine dehydratase [Candidatus Limnocylindria bacterium]